MGKKFTWLMILIAALAMKVGAQNSPTTIPVGGQKLVDVDKSPLNGTILITLTDNTNTPITYTPQGGSPTNRTWSATVRRGGIQPVGGFPFVVPSPRTTTPTGIVYRVQTLNSNGIVVWTLPLTQMPQDSWSVDGYIAQAGNPVTGTGSPTLPHCASGSQWTDTTNPTIPYGCSTFTVPDFHTEWTQNPSQNPMCPNQGVAYPFQGAPYCVPSTLADLLPNYVLGNIGAVPAPAVGVPFSGGTGGNCIGGTGSSGQICQDGSLGPANYNHTVAGEYYSPASWVFDSLSTTQIPASIWGFGGSFAIPQYVAGSFAEAGGGFFSCSVTSGASIPAGSIILFSMDHSLGTPTDGAGHTYTSLGNLSGGSLFYATTTTSGVVTISSPGVEVDGCSVAAYTGVDTGNPIDVYASTGSSLTVGPITTTVPNEIVVTFIHSGATSAPSAATGYTLNSPANLSLQHFYASQTATSTGTFSATWSGGSIGAGANFLVAIRAASTIYQTGVLQQWGDHTRNPHSWIDAQGGYSPPQSAGTPNYVPVDPFGNPSPSLAYDTANHVLKQYHPDSSSWVVVGGGGSGTVTGSGTALCAPMWTGSGTSTVLGTSPLCMDATGTSTATITTSTKITFNSPETDFVGTAGVALAIDFIQGTAPGTQAPNSVQVRSPASVPTAYGFAWPSAQGTGALTNDGAGNLTWATAESGFPITLGTTSIGSSSTTTSLAGLTVNGVLLNGSGSTSLFLNQAGGYTTPAAGISYPGAGIPLSTGSAWGTSYTAQGTDTKLLTAGTVSGTAASLCTDANGGATTSGCTATIPSQYKTWSCQPGMGDGLNAITAGTYLQTECLNTSGVTWTITGIKCFSDNSGASTMAVTNGAGTALLTGAVTCSSSFAAGTQSGTTTIASGDYLKFTFVADGTSKQSTWVVQGTY
jgi:hypothetical protein